MTAERGGLFERGKRALDTLLQLAQLRLELLSTELEQEKLRLFDALLRALVGLLLLGLGLVGLLAFVVMAFQEAWRLPALALLTLALGGGGLWLLQAARAALRGPPGGPFAQTLAELRRDRAALGVGDDGGAASAASPASVASPAPPSPPPGRDGA
jgi:uncharacterized membrane protein YqjE